MLMASGEIGKTPAIHLYKLTSEGMFLSLACMKGYHSKGVSQLCFSSDGKRIIILFFNFLRIRKFLVNIIGKQLFSVGVEYTVAVYCTDENHKQFGKMIASAQGPKSKVLHVCSSSNNASSHSSFEFFSCGEKHAIRWAGSLTGSLQQENIKLGSTKSMFMSACGLPGGDYLMCSYEGEILHIRSSKVTVMKLDSSSIMNDTVNSKAVTSGKEKGKDKSSKVNIIFYFCPLISNSIIIIVNVYLLLIFQDKKDDFSFNCSWVYNRQSPTTLVTGGKDGRVIFWQLSLESSTCKAVKQFSLGMATRAVCISENSQKLLVGTQRCSILEIDISSNDSTGEPFNTLVSGHFKDEVWGLAVRPAVPGYPRQSGETEVLMTPLALAAESKFHEPTILCVQQCNSGYQYATAGDDGFVRLWDVVQRKELIAWDMECEKVYTTYKYCTKKRYLL